MANVKFYNNGLPYETFDLIANDPIADMSVQSIQGMACRLHKILIRERSGHFRSVLSPFPDDLVSISLMFDRDVVKKAARVLYGYPEAVSVEAFAEFLDAICCLKVNHSVRFDEIIDFGLEDLPEELPPDAVVQILPMEVPLQYFEESDQPLVELAEEANEEMHYGNGN